MLPRRLHVLLFVVALGSCDGSALVLPAEGEPAAVAAVAGNDQHGVVARPLADPLVVRVTDTRDRPVVGQEVSFAVTSGDGASVEPASAVTDQAGEASAIWTLGTAAGQHAVVARVVGGGPSAGLEVAFTAIAGPGPAASLAPVRGDGQAGSAGSPLADSLVVAVADAFGNPVPDHPVAWRAGAGGVTASVVPTGADGRSAVGWTLGPAAGPQTATASAEGLTGSPITFTATANPGAAGRLAIVVPPSSSAQSGVSFARQPVVQLLDPNGNPVRQAGVAITAAIASGVPGSSLVGSATVATDPDGVASFGGLGITGGAGSYTLNFSGSGLTGVTSSAITIAAGVPARLALTTQPSPTAQSGVPFPRQPVVQVQDAAGNAVRQAGVTVTASIASGPGSLAGTPSRTTDATGAARFTDLAITGPVGARTLIFAASGLQSATSQPIDVRGGAPSASRSTVVAVPTTIAAGGETATITVTVRDAQDNPVPDVIVALSATGGGNAITQPGPTDARGVATGTFASSQPGTKTIAATAGSVAIAQTATITVTPGAPAGITMQSGDGQRDTVRATLPTPYAVKVTDAGGNPVPGVPVSWTVTGGGGSIAPAGATTDGNGIASATHTLGPAAGPQTADASSPGIGTVRFTSTADPGVAHPSRSTATVANGTVNTATTNTIEVRDQFGNPTAGGSDPSVVIQGANAGAAVTLTDIGGGTWTATYTPTAAGTDSVGITIDGAHVQGSPFTSQVT